MNEFLARMKCKQSGTTAPRTKTTRTDASESSHMPQFSQWCWWMALLCRSRRQCAQSFGLLATSQEYCGQIMYYWVDRQIDEDYCDCYAKVTNLNNGTEIVGKRYF